MNSSRSARSFFLTTRALRSDRSENRVLGIALLLLFFLGLLAWLTLSNLQLTVRSKSASLHVVEAVEAISSTVSARLQAVHIELGDQVHKGDLLLTLDSHMVDTDIASTEAILEALGEQVLALREESGASEAIYSNEAYRLKRKAETLRKQYRERQDIARLQAEILKRYESSAEQKLFSEIDALVAKKEQRQAIVTEDSTAFSLQEALMQLDAVEDQRREWNARHRRREAEVEESISAREERLRSLKESRERYFVRAAVNGKVSFLRDAKVGEYISAGDSLGDILPSSPLHVVAKYRAADTLGRVKRGQRGTISVIGFPRTRYGILEARVVEVGSAGADGNVTVHLALAESVASRIPLSHDLPVIVDITSERVTPWEYLLHILGVSLLPAV